MSNNSELLRKTQNDYGTRTLSETAPLTPPPSPNSFQPVASSASTPQNVDSIMQATVGSFGRWQLRVSLMAALLKFPIAWFQLGIVFMAPSTEFWCKRPPPDILGNITTKQWKAMIDVKNNHTQVEESFVHGSCYMHDPRASPQAPAVPCIWGYEFNTTEVHSSIITEWQMVCGRENLVDITQAVIMFGYLLGTICLGIASDHFGRKPVLISCLLVQSVAGVIASIVPSYILFLVIRLIVSFANAGTMICSFVICMEVVGGKWRTIVPILYQIPFGIGNTVMAVLAYFIRDWRQLQLVLSASSAIYLVYWKYLPESPRWLLATGKMEKAAIILKNAAAENKKSMADVSTVLENLPLLTSTIDRNQSKPSFKSLFNTPGLRRKTILLCIHWLLAGISFYGFSQHMGLITKHLYIMMAIAGLISLPGTFLCCLIVKSYGRRETIAGAHIFTAACYLGILAIPEGFTDWARMILAALGIIGLSISSPTLHLFTGETFPTVIRNAGMGITVMFCRLGSMIAPFTNALARITTWLPLAVLSTCTILESFLVIPLPETKDMSLPDTINDAEEFGRTKPSKNKVMK